MEVDNFDSDVKTGGRTTRLFGPIPMFSFPITDTVIFALLIYS